MRFLEVNPQDVHLSFRSDVDDDRLRVAYQLSNEGASTLAVYDGASGPPEQEWPDLSRNVYVSFEEPHVAHVKRVRPPLPQNVDIDSVFVPTASRLAPGEVREVRFSLPLPLAEHSQYFTSHSATWEERQAKLVQLWIGFFRATPGTVFQPLPQRPDIFRIRGEFAEQEYVQSRQDLYVPLLVRVDPGFERV